MTNNYIAWTSVGDAKINNSPYFATKSSNYQNRLSRPVPSTARPPLRPSCLTVKMGGHIPV